MVTRQQQVLLNLPNQPKLPYFYYLSRTRKSSLTAPRATLSSTPSTSQSRSRFHPLKLTFSPLLSPPPYHLLTTSSPPPPHLLTPTSICTTWRCSNLRPSRLLTIAPFVAGFPYLSHHLFILQATVHLPTSSHLLPPPTRTATRPSRWSRPS